MNRKGANRVGKLDSERDTTICSVCENQVLAVEAHFAHRFEPQEEHVVVCIGCDLPTGFDWCGCGG